MNATTVENRGHNRRPSLYDLIPDVCETFPRIGPGERLAPEQYRRLEDLRMKVAEALDKLVDQTRSMSMVLGMAIEADLLIDSEEAAGCVFLLQTVSDITAALR